jgi:hypothetical protein
VRTGKKNRVERLQIMQFCQKNRTFRVGAKSGVVVKDTRVIKKKVGTLY